LGFVLVKDVPLRLTPTAEAQYITRLPAGEWARFEKRHGKYLQIRNGHATGWIEENQFRLVCSKAGAGVGPPDNTGPVVARN
jgi:hypothetical protein